MNNQSDLLGHYLFNFILYTMGCIGFIYAIFWYVRRKMGLNAAPAPVTEQAFPLVMESCAQLDHHQLLYVIRAGNERFLMSVAPDSTQLLAKLENAEPPNPIAGVFSTEPSVQAPWYSERPTGVTLQTPLQGSAWKRRLMDSVRLLAESRLRK